MVYEDDHIKRAQHAGSWSVPYEEICLFCHVTTEGHILIGGERSKLNLAWWELRKYDEKVNFKLKMRKLVFFIKNETEMHRMMDLAELKRISNTAVFNSNSTLQLNNFHLLLINNY